jgi:hypothetical protein
MLERLGRDGHVLVAFFSSKRLGLAFTYPTRPNRLPMTGHTISPDIKRAAVRLTRAFPVAMVSVLLDISEDTIRRALVNSEETGDVVRADGGATRGRKRLLNEDDHRVSDLCLSVPPLPTNHLPNIRSTSVVWSSNTQTATLTNFSMKYRTHWTRRSRLLHYGGH